MPSNNKVGGTKLTRSEHVASLSLRPGRLAVVLGGLRRGEVALKILLCALVAIAIWVITSSWNPPFQHRTGEIPVRDIVARVEFTLPDPQATAQLRKQKRSELPCVYVHDERPIKELRSALQDRIFRILAAKSFDHVDADLWQEFALEKPTTEQPKDAERFDQLRAALTDEAELTQFDRALQRVFEPYEERGLLKGLAHAPDEGSQISVLEYTLGRPDQLQRVDVADVRIAEAMVTLPERFAKEFAAAGFSAEHVAMLVPLVNGWLRRHGLPTTLTFDASITQQQMDAALAKVNVEKTVSPGDTLAPGGIPLTRPARDLVFREYQTTLAHLTPWQRISYSLAIWGMYLALFVLCGAYIYYHQPWILGRFRPFIGLLAAVLVAIALGRLSGVDTWQAEIVPVTLLGMTITIAFGRDLALLMAFVVVLVLCLSLGFDLAQFVVLVATAATAVLVLGRVRSRTKLIYVGVAAGAAALLSSIGIGTVTGHAMAVPIATSAGAATTAVASATIVNVLTQAAWNGAGAVMAGVIMTGLLPFIERAFDIQTDISLLELGDAAHPLLQELARRAPGTYNHSITVASLAEAAAESIDAHSLLVRVGAYFHDIGKVFKPGYFVENQDRDTNLHESLMPAMSTLVIIAHVKDGADLGRQHRLPQSIINFVEQHHGTTLVEYFYQQATRQKELDPDKEDVQEGSFRYPGPRPQSRETGVLMLADAVESACRTLVDPTPARIENLVHQIAMKRLLDGQFDECGMSLQDLSLVEDSLVKSLMAVYHARVKYPDQGTA